MQPVRTDAGAQASMPWFEPSKCLSMSPSDGTCDRPGKNKVSRLPQMGDGGSNRRGYEEPTDLHIAERSWRQHGRRSKQSLSRRRCSRVWAQFYRIAMRVLKPGSEADLAPGRPKSKIMPRRVEQIAGCKRPDAMQHVSSDILGRHSCRSS